MIRTYTLAFVLSVAGFQCVADVKGEKFVEKTAQTILSTAQRGTSSNEIRSFKRLVGELVDVAGILESSFDNLYHNLSLRQRNDLEEALAANIAFVYAQALEGSERVEITGSNGNIVNSIIKANVDGLKEGLPLDWSLVRIRGSYKIGDINIAGRSAIETQRNLISTLLEISNGNLSAVVDGLLDSLPSQ